MSVLLVSPVRWVLRSDQWIYQCGDYKPISLTCYLGSPLKYKWCMCEYKFVNCKMLYKFIIIITVYYWKSALAKIICKLVHFFSDYF